MCLLRSCCGCFSLKTGSIISGVCGVVMAIVGLLVLFLCDAVQFRTIVLDWLPKNIVEIILAINLAMTILISVLLIIGVVKENVFLMLPWVILGIMLAVGLLVSIIYTAVELFIEEHVTYGIIWTVAGILTVVIYVYMWAVVFSYFQMIRDSRGRYMKAPYRR